MGYVTWDLIAQALIGGILLGGVYALVALGLNMVFGVMKIINLTHGTLIMLGSYATFWLVNLLGMNPVASLLLSMPIMFFLGMVLYRLVVWRIVGAPELTSLLVTFGISMILVNLALFFWTADFRSVVYLTGAFNVGPLALSKARVVSAVVALVIAAAAYAFLKYSRLGKAIRATSQNRNAARVCGIDVNRIDMFTFGLGSALAAGAGGLIAIMFAIFPQMGDIYSTKAFCVVVLGGLGSFVGAVVGGLILGVTESTASLFQSASTAEGVTFAVLLAGLLLRHRRKLEEKP